MPFAICVAIVKHEAARNEPTDVNTKPRGDENNFRVGMYAMGHGTGPTRVYTFHE